MTPMFLFSGIFFPLDGMPEIVAKIAWFTPLYHLVNVCRSFATGDLIAPLWDVLWLIVVVAILAPYPFRLMRKYIIK
jgi:lipooligosaccharide transport system permease protein